jgi:hypothetical protein
MTQEQKIIRAKVGMLELAKQLGSVSQACKVMGYSRDSFYRFSSTRRAASSLAEMTRRMPIEKNRVDPTTEKAVVEMAIERPAWGQVRVANEVKKKGLSISPFGVRSVWLRHDLETMKKRLKLGERHLRIGVDRRLLVDAPYPFQRADVERVPRSSLLCRAALNPGRSPLNDAEILFKEPEPPLNQTLRGTSSLKR